MNLWSPRFSKLATQKNWRISAIKVYLKLNQKVMRPNLSTYDEASCKENVSNCPIFRDIQLQTF